uniref:Uncharacterized protein n=1 Tax=Panagrolaimus sp. ES5 TaxID=591445 RepID=A0AC34GEV2_9BILA
MSFVGIPLRNLTPKVGAQGVVAARFASNEVTFQTRPYKLHKLDQGPASETTLTKED